MKTNIFKHITGIAFVGLLASALPMTAQENLRSGYFLKSNLHNHLINPALAPDTRAYIGIPGISNVNVGLQTNVGVSTFLFPTANNQLSLFLSEAVDKQEFLSGLPENVKTSFAAKIGLISFGFKAWGGFNTFDLNVRTQGYLKTNKLLFEIMKTGLTKESGIYELGNTAASAQAFIELALGHSRDINDQVRVGGKLKFLVGAAQMHAKMNNVRVKIADDQWQVSGDGEIVASAATSMLLNNQEAKAEYKPGEEKNLNWDKSFQFEEIPTKPAGFGVAVDLGAVYRINDDFEVSGAITDLGFLQWKDSERAYTDAKPWSFDGFKEIPYESKDENGNEKSNSIDNQAEDMKNQLEDFYKMKKDAGKTSVSKMLAANINVAGKYTLPAYRKLTFGVLASSRVFSELSWYEGRAFANIEPNKWFSFSMNGGYSTFGPVMGWMVNLHPGPIDFFLGTDYQFFKVTPKYYAPVNKGGVNLALGFNVRW